MNHHYNDIRSRIAEEPKWFDENATPRYCDFGPGETANIYADEAVLLLVRCQGCGREFRVCLSWSTMDGIRGTPRFSETVKDLEYGDPPNVDCCPAGPTMNSIPVRVLEFWRNDGHPTGWARLSELEVAIDCRWARD